jgi:hypothetical protein
MQLNTTLEIEFFGVCGWVIGRYKQMLHPLEWCGHVGVRESFFRR